MHPAQAMRGASIRELHSKVLTQGVSLISPTWRLVTTGIPSPGEHIQTGVEHWRGDIGWGQGGTGVSWNVVKTRSQAIHNSDHLHFSDFQETDLLFTARVQRYNVEATYAVSSGDLAENKNDETRLADIRKLRRADAEAAIYARLVLIPWQDSEVNQNAGLSLFSPTNVVAGVSYAGMPMNASFDGHFPWRPTGYDYGALTLDNNFFEIFDSLRSQLLVSAGAGGGAVQAPDFAVMAPEAWRKFMKYQAAMMRRDISSGSEPKNLDMLAKGFYHVYMNGVFVYEDPGFGGPKGYVDGAADEEILMGYHKHIKISHTATKQEGFIRAEPTVGPNAIVNGELGKFKTGLFAVYYDSPKFFQLAYT